MGFNADAIIKKAMKKMQVHKKNKDIDNEVDKIMEQVEEMEQRENIEKNCRRRV